MQVLVRRNGEGKACTKDVVLVASGGHARIESRMNFTMLRKFSRYESGV
jgi:hypothetical protein